MDKEVLERCLAQRLSREQIGKLVGRYPSTVGRWVRKHGLVPAHRARHGPKGGVDPDTLAVLVDEGLTIRQIAAQLRLSPTTVRHWLAKHGLTTEFTRRRSGRVPAAPRPHRTTRSCRKHGNASFVIEGRGYYRCAKYRQERVARRRRKAKEILVSEFGGHCAICGYSRHLGALEFHHVDPSRKDFGLPVRGMTRAIEQLRAEARKCVLVCANCHAEIEGSLTRYPSPAERSGVADR